MINLTKKQDLDFGYEMEKKNKPIIEKHLDCHLINMKKYHTFDYLNTDKKIFVELKSRNNNSFKYPSTMIGYNKIIYGLEQLKRGYAVYFYFHFTDGLFYYKMSSDIVDECEIKAGGRIDRGKREIKKYCYIPINKLKFV